MTCALCPHNLTIFLNAHKNDCGKLQELTYFSPHRALHVTHCEKKKDHAEVQLCLVAITLERMRMQRRERVSIGGNAACGTVLLSTVIFAFYKFSLCLSVSLLTHSYYFIFYHSRLDVTNRCAWAMSESTASASVAAAPLEETYVHLTAVLLLQLQTRDVAAALATAEQIQELCQQDASSAGATTAAHSLDSTRTAGQRLFEGSPAEKLLQMRADLNDTPTFPSSPHQIGFVGEKSTRSSSTSTESEKGDDSLSSTSSTTTTPSRSSSSSNSDSGSDAPQRTLEAALTAWAAIPSHVKQSTSATSKDTATAAASSSKARVPARPSPRPPVTPSQSRRRPPTQHSSPPGATASHDAADAARVHDADAEDEAVWERMQQQVAKEMERLAVVRKHR